MSDELGFRDRGMPRGDAFTDGEIEQWREETENILATAHGLNSPKVRIQTADWLREQVMMLFYDERVQFIQNETALRGTTSGTDDVDEGPRALEDWQALQQHHRAGRIEVKVKVGPDQSDDTLSELVSRVIEAAIELVDTN